MATVTHYARTDECRALQAGNISELAYEEIVRLLMPAPKVLVGARPRVATDRTISPVATTYTDQTLAKIGNSGAGQGSQQTAIVASARQATAGNRRAEGECQVTTSTHCQPRDRTK